MDSILLKNIQTFKKSVQEKVLYNDVNYKGIENEQVKVLNEKCILQAYKIWLQSDIYDYDRKPNFGGFITRNVIKKPLCEESCREIEAALISETLQFWPQVELVQQSVTFDLNRRLWKIKVAVRDKTTGLTDMSMFNNNTSIIANAI